MQRRMWIPLLVIAGCGGVIVYVWASRSGPPAAGNPVEDLRKAVAESSTPAEVVKRTPKDVAGHYILSLTSNPNDQEITVLETFAREASTADLDSLTQGRNAVMAAGHALAGAPVDSPGAPRLKNILLTASSSTEYRIRSTFIAVCTERPELLRDADISACVKRLAGANDQNLRISERAQSLLATDKAPIPPTSGG